MNAALSALGGAAAGAVVTVAVLQGSALIHDADGSTHRLAEGETHTVAPPEGQQKVHIQLPQAPAGETPAQAIARLEATVTALTDKLSSSQFTGAVAQGQLVAHVGTAQEWPEDIDEGFREASMAARVDKILAEHEGVELAEMDCSEYPCITVFRPTDPSEGWEQRLRPVAEAMSEGFEDVGLSVFASNNGNEDKQSSLMGVTVAPSGDNGRDSDVGARMHYRADTLLQELSQAELDAQD